MKNLIYLIIIIIFISCGARKAEKSRAQEVIKNELNDQSESKKQEEKQSQVQTNIKRSLETTVNNQDHTTTVKETLEPADLTKPASYKGEDGKTQELNNTKKTTETTTKNNNTKTDIREKIAEFKNESEKSKNKQSNKNDIQAKADIKKNDEDIHIDRAAYSLWHFLWIIIPLGIAYWCWHKYKKVT